MDTIETLALQTINSETQEKFVTCLVSLQLALP